MYSPLSVSREWEVVMNECGVQDYSSVMRWLVSDMAQNIESKTVPTVKEIINAYLCKFAVMIKIC